MSGEAGRINAYRSVAGFEAAKRFGLSVLDCARMGSDQVEWLIRLKIPAKDSRIPALKLTFRSENEAHRIKVEEGWQLRETQTAYRGGFEGQKAGLSPENTFYWDQSLHLTAS